MRNPEYSPNTLNMNSNSATINITFLHVYVVCMFARTCMWRPEAYLFLDHSPL